MRRAGAVTMAVFVWFLVRWAPPGGESISQVGDIVGSVKPEGFTGWGTEELKAPVSGGRYVRVHVPGLSMEEAEEYTGFLYDPGAEQPRVRRGRFDVKKLSSGAVEQEAAQTGAIEVQSQQFTTVFTKNR